MNIRKLSPWNWSKAEEQRGTALAPWQAGSRGGFLTPLSQLQYDIDRLFDRMFQSVGFDDVFGSRPAAIAGAADTLLRPQMDIHSTPKAYVITLEAPGVEEEHMQLELLEDPRLLCIKGEKKQQQVEEAEAQSRIERSYGMFQRTLALPEDADCGGIEASFKNGVLTVTVPRKAVEKPKAKLIELKKAS